MHQNENSGPKLKPKIQVATWPKIDLIYLIINTQIITWVTKFKLHTRQLLCQLFNKIIMLLLQFFEI